MVLNISKELYQSYILIVEDNAINAKILSSHLQKEGYVNLKFAKNGKEAIAEIELNKPDLIILDLIMPIMNGFEVLEKIRPLYACEALPIIVQTALTDLSETQRAWELGANDVLSKPIHKLELLSRVHVQLKQYWLLKELQDYKKASEEDVKNSLKLQLSLLPHEKMVFEIEERYNVKIDSIFRPCRFLSGDLWGLIPINDDQFSFWISDFSGKGIKAALNAFRVHTILNNQKEYQSDPTQLLEKSNHLLQKILQVGSFSTCLYGIMDIKQKEFSYAAASNPSPILYNLKNQSYNFLDASGFPLGVISNATYPIKTISLKDNENLVFYSDALLESQNDLGFSFEEECMDDFMSSLNGENIVPFVKSIIESLGSDDLFLTDDFTLVEIGFK